MLLTFREWWRSLWGWLFEPRTFPVLPPLPAPKRYRARMGRCVCATCQRSVAYSAVTLRTARHRCLGGKLRQHPLIPEPGGGDGA